MSSLKYRGHFLGASDDEASFTNKQYILSEVKEKKMHGEERCIHMPPPEKNRGRGSLLLRLMTSQVLSSVPLKVWLQFLLLASNRWSFLFAQISWGWVSIS